MSVHDLAELDVDLLWWAEEAEPFSTKELARVVGEQLGSVPAGSVGAWVQHASERGLLEPFLGHSAPRFLVSDTGQERRVAPLGPRLACRAA